MNIILALDADNTLWDTNEVFLTAQLSLLNSLTTAGRSIGGDQVKVLRETDMAIARNIGNFEYDSSLLVRALISVTAGDSTDEAARRVVDESQTDPVGPITESVAEMTSRFQQIISNQVPELLTGASELINWLESCVRDGTAIGYLVSEGNSDRVSGILIEHFGPESVKFLVPRIVPSKGVGDYLRVDSDGKKRLRDPSAALVAIGDSMCRDILPAQKAGAITIYRPAGFHGSEISDDSNLRPDHIIESLEEAIPILNSIMQRDSVTKL